MLQAGMTLQHDLIHVVMRERIKDAQRAKCQVSPAGAEAGAGAGSTCSDIGAAAGNEHSKLAQLRATIVTALDTATQL